jgi:hypothetical protein
MGIGPGIPRKEGGDPGGPSHGHTRSHLTDVWHRAIPIPRGADVQETPPA